MTLASKAIAGFLLLLALVPLLAGPGLRAWQLVLAARLWWRGVPVVGQVLGSRQDGAVTRYQVRFTTLDGYELTAYSQGLRLLPDPGYPAAARVSLRYDPRRPQHFLLDCELSRWNLLAYAGLIGLLAGGVGWAIGRQLGL